VESRAPIAEEPAFAPRHFAPPLDELAAMTEEDFRSRLSRQSRFCARKYAGFLRNVAVSMGNSGLEKFREPLQQLAAFPEPVGGGPRQLALDQLASQD